MVEIVVMCEEVGTMNASEGMMKDAAGGLDQDQDPGKDEGLGPGPEIAGQDPDHERGAVVVAAVKGRDPWISGKRPNRSWLH